MTTTSKTTAHPKTTSQSPFLDIFPAELRLTIYEHLLVSPTPLQGRSARNPNTQKYDLALALLRVNKQVYGEARAVFLGKNIFAVTRRGDSSGVEVGGERERDEEKLYLGGGENGMKGGERIGAILDPPLVRHQLPLVRHLSIELLDFSTPNQRCVETAAEEEVDDKVDDGETLYWRVVDHAFSTYVSTLITLLHHTTSLHTLKLTATSHSTNSTLQSFQTLDLTRTFAKALASLSPSIPSIPLSFVFEGSFFNTAIDTRCVADTSLLILACRVLFCQSLVRVRRMVGKFEEEGKEIECGVEAGMKRGIETDIEMGKVDLEPLVRAWPEEMRGCEEGGW